MKKPKWTNEEDNILKEYFGKISREEISNKLKRTCSAITYRAKVIGCESYDYKTRGLLTRGKNRHYELDMEFFDIPNLLNCYWAGFLAADGCIKSIRREVVIAIQERDISHLERFASDCCFTGPIKNIPAKISAAINGKKINSNPSVRLEFYGVDNWIKSLKNNFNIIDRKSLILEPPNLTNSNLILSFIAGYLDGDGCIYYNTRKNNLYISFRGTNNVLNWIKSILDVIAPLTGYRKGKEAIVGCDTHPHYILGGSRAIKIINEIKKLDLPFLNRKWDKINLIKPQEKKKKCKK